MSSCPYCGYWVVKETESQVKYFCCGEHRQLWRRENTKRGKIKIYVHHSTEKSSNKEV